MYIFVPLVVKAELETSSRLCHNRLFIHTSKYDKINNMTDLGMGWVGITTTSADVIFVFRPLGAITIVGPKQG